MSDVFIAYVSLAAGMVALALALVVALLRSIRLNRELTQGMNERQEVERALVASEDRLRRLVDTAPYPLIEFNADDRIATFMNRRAKDMFIVTSGSDKQLSSIQEYFIDPTLVDGLIAEIMEKGSIENREIQLKRANGEVFWALTSCTRLEMGGEPVVLAGLSDITERKVLEDELRQMASRDPLTGLANRAEFLEIAHAEVARSRRSDYPLSVLAIDIDQFNHVKETYGRHMGDTAIKGVARMCSGQLREMDFIGRLDQHDFAVVLPETDLETAQSVSERLRRAVTANSMVLPDGTELRLSISVGTALMTTDDDSLETTINRAHSEMTAIRDAVDSGTVSDLTSS